MCTQKSSRRGFPSKGANTAAGGGGRGKGRGSALGMQTEARTQARVYVVTQKDADVALDVVTGIFSILDHDAYTLVDLRAKHSFASNPFLDRFQIETQPLGGYMRVSVLTFDYYFEVEVSSYFDITRGQQGVRGLQRCFTPRFRLCVDVT